MLRRIAAAGDVDHRRHVELDHLLVERIPPLVGQRRRVEVAARRIGIEVAADEAHLHAALELGDRILRRHALRLRQLADADEILRIERDDARIRSLQICVHSTLTLSSPIWWPMPEARGEKIVMSVPRSRCSLSWAPSTLSRISSSLIFSDAFDGIGDFLGGGLGLLLAEAVQVLGLGRVVSVTIDDHGTAGFEMMMEHSLRGRSRRPGPRWSDATNRALPLSNRPGRALAVVMEHRPPSLYHPSPIKSGGKLQRMIQYPPAGRCGTWLPDRESVDTGSPA